MPSELSLNHPVSVLVIASVVVVSVVGYLSSSVQNALIMHPYLVRTRWQVYRMLTGGWLHAGAMHLGFNMVTLYFFSGTVLRILGPTNYLILYFSAVVLAHTPSLLWHMNDRRYSTMGASGAVAGIMFAAIMLEPKQRVSMMFLPIGIPGVLFAAGYLVYTLYQSYVSKDNINHGAHFAGAVYGAFFTYLLEPARVHQALHSLSDLHF